MHEIKKKQKKLREEKEIRDKTPAPLNALWKGKKLFFKVMVAYAKNDIGWM